MTKINDTLTRDTSFTFKLAETQTEKNEIYNSRYEIAKEKFPYLFNTSKYGHIAKDGYDDHSFLFYCKDKAIIGSCRASPIINGKWEFSDALPEYLNFVFNDQSTLQLNRVYIDENHRNKELHALLFYNFSCWVINNTSYTRYFAICNAGLVRMYKRLGAELLLEQGFELKDRSSHNYYLVGGQIEDIINTIEHKH
ncbi:GNAT family N-acetyltransferase [Flavobacterium salmonis]|uniref:N-acetyltransferase domain-containing protein n=1 Tax=Flavobacterium salmonis TaxID=2654844 RepID=A0A6V6YWK2_9FLAO|nr:GNAT family N-acetyltransferase [Flavobacterium salmonis]CAD0003918.1 hypothetical protein FLAT13_01943 [Flavobacterium salmonis]